MENLKFEDLKNESKSVEEYSSDLDKMIENVENPLTEESVE